MKFNVDKLKQIARPLSEESKRKMDYRRENRDWLRMSEHFALKLRRIMDADGISQAELSRRMEVSPAQITKILSGKENLQLKTIAKINKALGRDVVDFSIDDALATRAYSEKNSRQVVLTCFYPANGKPYRATFESAPVFKDIPMISNLC